MSNLLFNQIHGIFMILNESRHWTVVSYYLGRSSLPHLLIIQWFTLVVWSVTRNRVTVNLLSTKIKKTINVVNWTLLMFLEFSALPFFFISLLILFKYQCVRSSTSYFIFFILTSLRCFFKFSILILLCRLLEQWN